MAEKVASYPNTDANLEHEDLVFAAVRNIRKMNRLHDTIRVACNDCLSQEAKDSAHKVHDTLNAVVNREITAIDHELQNANEYERKSLLGRIILSR